MGEWGRGVPCGTVEEGMEVLFPFSRYSLAFLAPGCHHGS